MAETLGTMSRTGVESQPRIVAAVICALAGAAVFQWFGNANHGYIDTNSLFWWWGFQWWNPQSETQHGWLVLAIAVGLLVRNLGISDFGLRIADSGKPESGEWKPETGNGKPERVGTPVGPSVLVPDRVGGERHAQARPYEVAALGAMVGALALHTLGFAAQQARLSILALLLFTWGVLRLGGGRRWGRAAAFPLAFMVFAIPLNALDTLGFWLRLWVINASSGLAHAFGIGVVQSGTQLMAPDGRYNYDVAAACSGIRSLMAMAALSLLIGYVMFHSWWRRALMLLLCFPLVYVGNVARIWTIIVAAQAGGAKWGDRAHETMGWVVFVIVLGGVLVAALALERVAPEEGNRKTEGSVVGAALRRDSSDRNTDRGAKPLVQGDPEVVSRVRVTPAYQIAGVVVLFALGDALFLHRLATIPPRGEVGVALARDGRNPIELPTFLGSDWVGTPAVVTDVEREMLPPDTGYSRMNYLPSRGTRPVFLSIVLSGRDRTSIHRPELCLVGQGWTIRGQTSHRFSYPGHPDETFPATVLRVQRHLQTPQGAVVVPQLVVYWFASGDGVVATHWQRLAHDAWNRVVHARADRWAYVLLQTDATDGEPAAFARLQSVLDGTLPVFEPVHGPADAPPMASK